MKTTERGMRSAERGVAQTPERGPFRPRKGRVQLSAGGLVIGAAVVIAAATLATVAARSHDTRSELLRKAALAKQKAQLAEEHLRHAKLSAGIQPDPSLLPTDSPWLGGELTLFVTTLGSLEAKRAAANPDWARVLTLRLYEAGVRSNTVVAAGCSGSFPGLNLALACACEALGADLVAVSSVTASTWGANQPGFTWPEIEAQLAHENIIHPVSAAVSVGGQGDMAFDLESEAQRMAGSIQAIACAVLGASALKPVSLRDSIDQRMQLYRQRAAGRRIVLYVNVGGTQASLGESAASFRLRSGFIPGKPFDLSPGAGVIARFAAEGVPSLSLLHIEGLAFQWGVAH